MIVPFLRHYPEQVVIVHHAYRTDEGLLLQLERRNPQHTECSFDRVHVTWRETADLIGVQMTEVNRLQWCHHDKEISDKEFAEMLKPLRSEIRKIGDMRMAMAGLTVRKVKYK